MRKSSIGFVLISSMLLLSMFGFVSAQAAGTGLLKTVTDLFSGIIDGVIQVAQPLLKLVLGDFTSSAGVALPDIVMQKLLLMILVLSIVYLAVGRIPLFEDRKALSWVISIAVSILAIRFLTNEWVASTVLPYSVLGMAVSAGLPFVLYFFIVKDFASKTLRRTAWIFFAVIFLFLYAARAGTGDAATNTALNVYPITAFFALLMAFFDGTVQKFFSRLQSERAHASKVSDLIRDQRRKLSQVSEDYANGLITNIKDYERKKKDILRTIETLGK